MPATMVFTIILIWGEKSQQKYTTFKVRTVATK